MHEVKRSISLGVRLWGKSRPRGMMLPEGGSEGAAPAPAHLIKVQLHEQGLGHEVMTLSIDVPSVGRSVALRGGVVSTRVDGVCPWL